MGSLRRNVDWSNFQSAYSTLKPFVLPLSHSHFTHLKFADTFPCTLQMFCCCQISKSIEFPHKIVMFRWKHNRIESAFAIALFALLLLCLLFVIFMCFSSLRFLSNSKEMLWLMMGMSRQKTTHTHSEMWKFYYVKTAMQVCVSCTLFNWHYCRLFNGVVVFSLSLSCFSFITVMIVWAFI